MDFFYREERDDVIHLYKILSKSEFEIIKGHKFKTFPQRFFVGKTFTAIIDKEYIERVLSEQNNLNKNLKELYVVRFLCKNALIKKYIRHNFIYFGSSKLKEDHLHLLNNSIIGLIELYKKIDLGSA